MVEGSLRDNLCVIAQLFNQLRRYGIAAAQRAGLDSHLVEINEAAI